MEILEAFVDNFPDGGISANSLNVETREIINLVRSNMSDDNDIAHSLK